MNTRRAEAIIENLEHKLEDYKKENKELTKKIRTYKAKLENLTHQLEAILDARTTNP